MKIAEPRGPLGHLCAESNSHHSSIMSRREVMKIHPEPIR